MATKNSSLTYLARGLFVASIIGSIGTLTNLYRMSSTMHEEQLRPGESQESAAYHSRTESLQSQYNSQVIQMQYSGLASIAGFVVGAAIMMRRSKEENELEALLKTGNIDEIADRHFRDGNIEPRAD